MTDPTYRQSHEAMKTVFQIRLFSGDLKLARQVARACVERIDAIEAALSRYWPGNDVWQINHLQAGETLFIGEDCERCLRLATLAGIMTGGLFDVTLGRLIEHQKNSLDSAPPAIAGCLQLDPDRPLVECLEAGREIDLGGIGKGYALDELARLCAEWGIAGGLLSAGASTQLAFGAQPWNVTLRGNQHTRILALQNGALSASGTAIQGSHIVSPQGGAAHRLRERVWVETESAAMADAFSTAALLSNNLKDLQTTEIPVRIFIENSTDIDPV